MLSLVDPLKELAVLAATIERLVRNEADMLLNVAQTARGREVLLWGQAYRGCVVIWSVDVGYMVG